MTEPLPAAPPPEAVAIVVHSGRTQARDAATAAAKRFGAAGVGVVGSVDDEWPDGLVEQRDSQTFGEDVDVVIVFGGDGTLLRAAYLSRDWGIPLLGINLGRLGFLSEVEIGDLDAAIDDLLAGRFEVEERMTLSVQVRDARGGRIGKSWALNEAAVERDTPERLMVYEVRVGETTLANVPADAIICATPTGSTAYAFSARGPILSPLLDAILIVPVAPHSLFDRTLVVGPTETLEVRPHEGGAAARVSLDGRESLAIPAGGSVQVARGDAPVRMIRLAPFDFYARVRDKFGLR
jgi:NAD+ kinase